MERLENLDGKEEDWVTDWERRRRLAVAQVLYYIGYAIYLCHVNFQNDPEDHQPTSCTEGQPKTSPEDRKRKAPDENTCEREFRNLRKAICNVAEAIREGNLILSRSRAVVYSEAEVYKELMRIDVDRNVRYTAYIFLIKSASRVRAFFGCPVQERKDLLVQMMDGSLNF